MDRFLDCPGNRTGGTHRRLVWGRFGVGIITLGEVLLPWGLAFAAGAMLFVIGDEVIP